jgi:hypothetical protein
MKATHILAVPDVSFRCGKLKNSMEQSHSREADSSSASGEIPRSLSNFKFHYGVHKGPPLFPVLSSDI